jgi:hypothetical protein
MSQLREHRFSVALGKINEIREALRRGRRVSICIPIVEITAIALDGDEDDRVYFNGLGTVVFIDDLERAKVEIQ